MKRKTRKRRDYHVVPYFKCWAVRREGAKRVSGWELTQGAAIERARELALKRKVEVVIHRADGTIRDSDTYGREGKAKDRKH